MNAITEFFPASRPMLPDLRSCEAWLARASLGDPRAACASFIELLDEIEDAPPRAAVYVDILERLRPQAIAALEEQARRLSARALPLGATEAVAFTQASDLWLALLRALQRLQQATEIAPQRALLSLRAVEAAAGLVSLHLAARREVEESAWRWLHQCYAHAERQHYADIALANERSCQAVYAEVLLVSLAHPCGLSPRDMTWLQRWARRWSGKVELWRSAENGGGIAVNLEEGCGPAWTAAGVPGALRFIDCSEVNRSVRRRLRRLSQGADPAELGLGRDCARPAVDDLLAMLARSWSDQPHARQFPRRASTSTVEVATGIDRAYHALHGAAFEREQDVWAYSRRNADEIHIFQRAVSEVREAQATPSVEAWEAVDESANGFQLVRRGPGARIAHRQLLALRPRGASRFILCEVRWLREQPDLALAVGARALPGAPQGAAIRCVATEPWQPCFVLPLVDGLPPTLLLGAGVHQPGRRLELKLDGRSRAIVLGAARRHGADFDWVDFSAA